jgi:hypothetical protein
MLFFFFSSSSSVPPSSPFFFLFPSSSLSPPPVRSFSVVLGICSRAQFMLVNHRWPSLLFLHPHLPTTPPPPSCIGAALPSPLNENMGIDCDTQRHPSFHKSHCLLCSLLSRSHYSIPTLSFLPAHDGRQICYNRRFPTEVSGLCYGENQKNIQEATSSQIV